MKGIVFIFECCCCTAVVRITKVNMYYRGVLLLAILYAHLIIFIQKNLKCTEDET